MAVTSAPPLAGPRRAVLVALLVLSAVSWVVVLAQQGAMGGPADNMGGAVANALTMGMTAPVFLATWTVMMAAMMLPSAAPMILMFDAVQSGRARQGRSTIPTWVFTSAYLAVWVAIGVVAYALALAAGWVSGVSPGAASAAPRIAGALILCAGVYQLTPLKQACLSHCRTPTAFVLGSWRNGYRGAFRMGVGHGLYCLGCCWFLFVLLFPLGIMNVAAMAAIALLVLAEKTLPVGRRLSQATGMLLIAAGAAVIALPTLLPMPM